MFRALSILLVALLLIGALVSASGHKCATSDCSDIVGEGLVKENLGRSQHFTESHHDELSEAQRLNRIELARRGDL